MKQAARTAILTMALLLAALALSACAGKTPAVNTPHGIATLEEVSLGGVGQWILIRGRDVNNPMLLFVHGGPGTPEMLFNHAYGAGLEDHFVVVHWDQRGAGKSMHAGIPAASMTVDQFVSDSHELTLLLKERFGRDKIYLLGHSWGSLLGVLTVSRHPGDYYAYVGVGQVVDMRRNEEISYRFVLDRAREQGDQRAIRRLEKIGPPPYDGIGELVVQRRYLQSSGGAVYDPEKFKEIMAAGMHAPEYTALDLVKFAYGGFFSTSNMWDEITGCDLIEQAPRIEVPVYFFEGRHDYNTPWELVEEYYRKLDAPRGKSLIWFGNSAHSPNLEEPELFARMMAERVLAETYPGIRPGL